MKHTHQIAFNFCGKIMKCRPLLLLLIVVTELCVIKVYWDGIDLFIKGHEWVKGLLTILIGAPPGYMIWYWRDQNKLRDQEQTERELRLKEDNDAWDNFRKYQEIVENPKASDAQKTSAIFALGSYYRRKETKFPRMVHAFYKQVLASYWNQFPGFREYEGCQEEFAHCFNKYGQQKQTLKKELDRITDHWQTELQRITLPKYIRAVHEVFQDIFRDKSLQNGQGPIFFSGRNSGRSLDSFLLMNANLSEENLSEADLSGANLCEANLRDAFLRDANLCNVNLRRTNLCDANLCNADLCNADLTNADLTKANLYHANFASAKLYNADLSMGINLDSAILTNAKYTKKHKQLKDTEWPEGFNPEDPKYGMICLSGDDPL